jgi:hypothetical protein
MENKKLCFGVDASSITLREIMNRSFLELSMRAISSAKPNINMSWFTPDSLKKAIPTFKNKPILGFFQNGDFGTHDGVERRDIQTGIDYWDTLGSRGERVLGLIRSEDKVEVVEDENQKGLYWIQLTCALWTQYAYQQIKRLVQDALAKQKDGKGAKSISVEIDILDGQEIEVDGQKILQINDFMLDGITILGSKNGVSVDPGIAGASVFVDGLGEDSQYAQQKSALRLAYAKLDSANKEEGFEMKIKLDKSKEALSDKAWGSVNKTALRDKVVGAENAAAVVHSIYLQVGKGWEKAPSENLKYPVMEVKDDGTAVYNRGALAAAKGYAEKNGEKAVLAKVDGLYKKLGLDEKKETESYCGDTGFAQLCDMCKDSPDGYCKFDGECEPDPEEVDEAAKLAAQTLAAKTDGEKKPDEKQPDEKKPDDKKPDDKKPDGKQPDDKKEKESAEPKPGEGTPTGDKPLEMKKKMSDDGPVPEEHKTDPVSDIAGLISDYGWRGDTLSRVLEHYEKAEDVPGKEYVVAVLKKFKAINDACLAEAAELLEKAAKGFSDDDMAFAKRCAEKCSCGGDIKECDELSAKCAALEQKCSASDTKCAELEKKCAEDEKCSAELSAKCAAFEKQELYAEAKKIVYACSDLSKDQSDVILKACESGELKTLDDVKNKTARAVFDARFNAIDSTVNMPIVNPQSLEASKGAESDGADKTDKTWERIHQLGSKAKR